VRSSGLRHSFPGGPCVAEELHSRSQPASS
jgi:hypothetical protein